MGAVSRAEHREQQMEAILEAGRRQLAERGAAALSLREVARDVGLVSSAVYRYVANRDELLTLLITAAFDDLGESVEMAEATRRRSDLRGRWRTAGTTVRAWAHEHPHEWALVYGSPVPGYVAPQSTVGPATRVTAVLGGIVADAVRTGRLDRPGEGAPRGAGRALDTASLDVAMPGVPPAAALRAMTAWTGLVGYVGLELFGHFGPLVADPDRAFAAALDELAEMVGIA
jgi:AcrR family transcriptional regulator